ncbi:hypothetical protein V8B97DRAFT_1913798 [Scleroderma yunnanense]
MFSTWFPKSTNLLPKFGLEVPTCSELFLRPQKFSGRDPTTLFECGSQSVIINGTEMTPRISEDSWRCLCSLLPGAKSTPGSQTIVTIGSIEFDIDLNRAVWMDEWVSGTSRSSGRLSQNSPACPVLSTCSERATAVNHTETTTELLVTNSIPGVPAKASAWRSNVELYPPRYPHNVHSVCPDVKSEKKEGVTVNLPCRFPWMDGLITLLAPDQWVYPYIVPEMCADITMPTTSQALPPSESLPEPKCVNVRLSAKYPSLDICNYQTFLVKFGFGFISIDPPVYPWNLHHTHNSRSTPRPPSMSRINDLPEVPSVNHRDKKSYVLTKGPDSGLSLDSVTRPDRRATGRDPDKTMRRKRRVNGETHATAPGLLGTTSHPLHPDASRGAHLMDNSNSSVAPPVTQLPPPIRIRSPVIPPPALVVSETPLPHVPVQPPTKISRLSGAVKSIVPSLQRSKSLRSTKSPVSDDDKERTEGYRTVRFTPPMLQLPIC